MANHTAREPQFPVPAEGDLGDAMLQLSVPMRAFVTAMMETGGQGEGRAAYLAGYGGTIDSAKVAASRMMRMPTVLAAIREEADRRLRSGGILAASALVEIANDMKHKDRFKAAVELLNRSGLLVEQTHRVIHEDHRSDAEIERAVANLATKYGIDPAKLLGTAAAKISVGAVDAEFVEITEAMPEETGGALTGAEGLEDLLG